MNPYQIIFGSMWPTAPKHEQFPGRNPQKEEQKSEVIDLTPTDGSRKPNAWYRKDFQENCVRILALLEILPDLLCAGFQDWLADRSTILCLQCRHLTAADTLQRETPLMDGPLGS